MESGHDGGGVARSWAVARVDEIPDDHPAGSWEIGGFNARWFPIRRHLGIRAFGMSAAGADAGQEIIPPHREADLPDDPSTPYVHGQEEVYYVARGAMRAVLDGEEVELREGEIVFVQPQVHRAATALRDDTLVLCVGGTPGQPYSGHPAGYDWKAVLEDQLRAES
jgi:mannose-6-phosphate isomerase-like protein (cupin superfamily)